MGIPGTSTGGVTSDAQKRITELQREQEELTLLAAAHRMGAQAIENANDSILIQKELLDAKVDLTSTEGQEILRLIVANEELRRSIDDIVEAEKNHNKAVDDINKRLTDLFPTFENLRAEADAWRTEALAGLDATKAGYAEFAADVERIYAEQIRKARNEDLDNSREWSDGITRALRDYVEEASDGAAQMENVTRNALGGMEDAFAKWASTGKASARDMVTSILADLARIAFRQTVTAPLLGALGFAAHGGALVGSGGAARQVSMAAFATAQRYHSGGMPGMGPNEVPIIAQRGEEVITRADPRHRFNGGGAGGTFISNVSVNVNGGAGGGAQVDNRAMGEEIAILVSRAVQAEMAEFVRQQMRPGNMLNPSGGQSYGY
jgi:lambda family phage tail tape measure protein